MSEQTTTTQAFTSVPEKLGNEVLTIFKSTEGLILGACLVGFVTLSVLGNGTKKGKLARGRFGGNREKRAARKLALKQMDQKKRNAVSLYIGQPLRDLLGRSDTQTLYLPDAQRGIAVCGGPGTGKTYSVINPALRSAIDQGHAMLLYDFKYPSQSGKNDGSSQTEQIVGYAERAGYDISFFCPGFKESAVCNPLDFLQPRHGLPAEADAETARQMSLVMNRNFRMFSTDKEDPFFGPAGDQLVTAIFMLAKSSDYADMMMCQALLSVEDLVKRLQAAELNPWIRAAFGQFLSVGKSEKTVASIAGTANIIFSRFIMPAILSAICGKTTLPLDLDRKQLIVFGMDRERRDVVGPLLATVLHMIVNRNVAKGRDSPLVLSLDEVPTLYLPTIVNWLNENRSDGLVSILGFQNIVQLEEVYGKKFKSILGGCATKAIFNPQEPDSAKHFSEYLGEEEIHFKQKSHGSSGGKGSSNVSDQDRTRKLFEPSQFLKLPKGRCILISPGYENKEEASIPLNQMIKIPAADIRFADESVADWEAIRAGFVVNSSQRTPNKTALCDRYEASDQLIPMPQKV